MSSLAVIVLVTSFWIYYIHSEVVNVSQSACKDNEIFVECAHCGPKNCDDLGHPIPCHGVSGLCQPECVCADGYVRDANDTCIAKSACPSCEGDFNATSGCGNHCGQTCSDYNEVNKTCMSGCRYNSCDCKKGFVYHDTLEKCVLPIDCCEVTEMDRFKNKGV